MKSILIPKSFNEELAEETGWHIGDGSMNFYKQGNMLKGIYQLRGHIEDDKEHYLQRIKPLFETLYGTEINIREMPSTRVFGFQIWNDELVSFKQNLGLPSGRKTSIIIPQVFLQNKDLIIAVLRGIFDTDGGIYLENKNNKPYPRIYITTISLELSKQLVSLFNGLGLRATSYLESGLIRGKREKSYKVEIRGEEMFYKFMELINPKNPKHFLKYQNFLQSKKL